MDLEKQALYFQNKQTPQTHFNSPINPNGLLSPLENNSPQSPVLQWQMLDEKFFMERGIVFEITLPSPQITAARVYRLKSGSCCR
jgi:hypothetical protein